MRKRVITASWRVVGRVYSIHKHFIVQGAAPCGYMRHHLVP
jgi:hypothetical protein